MKLMLNFWYSELLLAWSGGLPRSCLGFLRSPRKCNSSLADFELSLPRLLVKGKPPWSIFLPQPPPTQFMTFVPGKEVESPRVLVKVNNIRTKTAVLLLRVVLCKVKRQTLRTSLVVPG